MLGAFGLYVVVLGLICSLPSLSIIGLVMMAIGLIVDE